MTRVAKRVVVVSGSLLTLIVPAGFALTEDVQIAQGLSEARAELAETGSVGEFPQETSREQVLSVKTPFSGVPLGVTAKLAAEILETEAADYERVADAAPDALTALDWSGTQALAVTAAGQVEQGLTSPVMQDTNLSAEFSIAAPAEMTGLDFDVGVAPRISVTRDGEFVSRRVGGEVRVGQGLSNFAGNGEQPKGWYLFAGADGEALVWDNAGALGDMAMTDQLTVGDMQAGVSMQRMGGQLSLSYIRREVKFDDRNRNFEETEDFAGLSFTRRY